MSTTTSLPTTFGQKLSEHSHRGAVVPQFETEPNLRGESSSQVLRVDVGSPVDTHLAGKDPACPETALAVLANSAVAELRFLRVDETEKSIHLSGRVRSFYHKQLAQEAMRPIAEGRLVVNQVEVLN